MPVGISAGRKIADLTDDYLRLLRKQGTLLQPSWLREAIAAEIRRHRRQRPRSNTFRKPVANEIVRHLAEAKQRLGMVVCAGQDQGSATTELLHTGVPKNEAPCGTVRRLRRAAPAERFNLQANKSSRASGSKGSPYGSNRATLVARVTHGSNRKNC
jgi:hypothetical protein